MVKTRSGGSSVSGILPPKRNKVCQANHDGLQSRFLVLPTSLLVYTLIRGGVKLSHMPGFAATCTAFRKICTPGSEAFDELWDDLSVTPCDATPPSQQPPEPGSDR